MPKRAGDCVEVYVHGLFGQFHGSVYDCLWLASGPLYDLFESVFV